MSETERWQLSGSGPDSYERYQVPSVFGPLAEIFLGHVPLEPGHRVLDVACGTGVVTRLVAPLVGPAGQVVGVDLNPAMLDVARQKAPAEGANIAWREGDAAALPCPSAGFDVVVCQQGLQFFPDKAAALREMHRVLEPGGCLALCVWRSIEHSPCNLAAAQALHRHVGSDSATKIQAPCAFGDADALRSVVRAAGFHGIDIRTEVLTRRMLPPETSIPGHLASTPVGPDIAALDEATRETLIREIAEALSGYQDRDGMAIPQGTHIVLARK